MNKHHYKVIFDRDLQQAVVVSELAKSRSKPSRTVCAGDVIVFSDRVVSYLSCNPANSQLITNSLTFSDITNESAYKSIGAAASYGGGRTANSQDAQGEHYSQPLTAIPMYGSERHQSTTRATLTEGTIILNKDSTPTQTTASALGINTEINLAHHQVKEIDEQKLQDKQQLGQAVGQLGAMSVGTLSQKMGYEDGSIEKIALHGLLGYATAEAAGGNGIVGATAGAGGEIINTKVADYLATETELNAAQRKSIQNLTAGLTGAGIGALTGDNTQAAMTGLTTALNAEMFNRQLHPDETKWIKENAKQFAEQEGISEEAAQRRLSQQAAKDLDILWFLMLNDDIDSSAKNFLATQKNQQFRDANGTLQHYFVAKDNDFWTPRMYAKEAYTYNQRSQDNFIERNLQSGIVRSAWQGLKEKTGKTANTVWDNKLETAKSVGKAIWDGATDCLGSPLDCAGNFGEHVWTTGTSSGAEMAKNLFKVDQREINTIYGDNMEPEMAVVSSAQFLGVATEVGGVTAIGKQAGKTVVKETAQIAKEGAKVVKDQVNRVTNNSALKTAINETDNIAVATKSGYINSTKICDSACILKPTSNTERALIDDIVKNGDPLGSKTEGLIADLAKRSGYTPLKGGKYGTNNGFDHVLLGKDGTVVIIDSKQIKNGAVKVNTNGASLNGEKTIQLSENWIKAVYEKLPDGDPVKNAINNALDTKKTIKAIIAGVDKSDTSIKLIPVEIPNK